MSDLPGVIALSVVLLVLSIPSSKRKWEGRYEWFDIPSAILALTILVVLVQYGCETVIKR